MSDSLTLPIHWCFRCKIKWIEGDGSCPKCGLENLSVTFVELAGVPCIRCDGTGRVPDGSLSNE